MKQPKNWLYKKFHFKSVLNHELVTSYLHYIRAKQVPGARKRALGFWDISSNMETDAALHLTSHKYQIFPQTFWLFNLFLHLEIEIFPLLKTNTFGFHFRGWVWLRIIKCIRFPSVSFWVWTCLVAFIENQHISSGHLFSQSMFLCLVYGKSFISICWSEHEQVVDLLIVELMNWKFIFMIIKSMSLFWNLKITKI